MTTRPEKAILALAAAAILPPAFHATSALSYAHRIPPPGWLATRVDRGLPVVPESVWLYLSWYGAPIILMLLPREDFRRAYGAVLVAFILCLVGHLLFPVALPRPALDPSRSPSEAVLAILYKFDLPVGLFPSFHAALAAILIGHCPAWRTFPRLAVGGWMIAICSSCVLIKQHYVLDVATGWVVGICAMRSVVYLSRLGSHSRQRVVEIRTSLRKASLRTGESYDEATLEQRAVVDYLDMRLGPSRGCRVPPAE